MTNVNKILLNIIRVIKQFFLHSKYLKTSEELFIAFPLNRHLCTDGCQCHRDREDKR